MDNQVKKFLEEHKDEACVLCVDGVYVCTNDNGDAVYSDGNSISVQSILNGYVYFDTDSGWCCQECDSPLHGKEQDFRDAISLAIHESIYGNPNGCTYNDLSAYFENGDFRRDTQPPSSSGVCTACGAYYADNDGSEEE